MSARAKRSDIAPQRCPEAAPRSAARADARQDGASDAGIPEPPEVLDLRLLPVAIGSWSGAALGVVGGPAAVRWIGTAAIGVVLVLVVVPRCRRPRQPSRRVAATVALGLLVLTLALLDASTQRALRTGGLLATTLREGATATVTGRVVDRPVPLDARWSDGEPDRRYTVAVRWVESRGRRSGAAASVVVVAPGDVPPGSIVRVTGRLTPSSATDGTVATLQARSAAEVVARPGWPDRAAEHVRAATRRIASRLPADAGALLLGMALGDSSGVPDDLSEAMRTAGLTHLIAVSGSHFALVGAIAAAAAAACRLPVALRAGVVVLTGAGLLVLVGPQPSVLRAAVTGVVGLLGLLSGRPARAPAALATTVTALLLADPWLAFQIGFALSVAATAAIVVLGGAWVRVWSPRLGRPLAAAVAAPLAAQLACAPVLLVLRPSVGTYALLANLAAAPAVPPATVLGLLTAVVAPCSPHAALLLAQLAGAACWWVAAVARVAAAGGGGGGGGGGPPPRGGGAGRGGGPPG
ncbi:ComEC/Rec2 family competence protein, partial [Cellulomonas sp. SG140]|uniref:ComEC/Rec2 family competence protein n=1 Tax=Cellulomonas sp. SG140 TaxID=2976536 RepID=UPI0021E86393